MFKSAGETFLTFAHRLFALLALGDVAKGPDAPVVFSIPAPHRRRVTIQDRAVLQLDLIMADLVQMGIQMDDSFDELLGMPGHVHDPLELFRVIRVDREGGWNFEQFDHPLILQNLFPPLIHDDDAVEG